MWVPVTYILQIHLDMFSQCWTYPVCVSGGSPVGALALF